MKLVMIFDNGVAEIIATAETEWERLMIGALTSGETYVVDAMVECESRSHYTHGKVDSARIRLKRPESRT